MNNQEMVDVIQAESLGKKIQSRHYYPKMGEWVTIGKPSWNFALFDYRVKPDLKELWVICSEREIFAFNKSFSEANLKLSFDLSIGKLIKAEIL